MGGLFPLVEVTDWHKAAAPLERFAEGRPVLDPFGLGVDVCEADFDVLGPVPPEILARSDEVIE